MNSHEIAPVIDGPPPAAPSDILEQVLIKGDLARLTPEERCDYYKKVCQSIGLNPLTKPFEYITLNGKLTLYARRDAADQLRKINKISIEILERSVSDGLMIVHVRARDSSGRVDEDMGIVNISGLKGEAAANAMLKAITKAKRRVTLSISGLGFLDETEVEDIPTATRFCPTLSAPQPLPPVQEVQPPINPETDTVSPHSIPIRLNGGNKPDWLMWGSLLAAAFKASKTPAEVHAWQIANATPLKALADNAPKISERLSTAARVAKSALG